MLRRLVQNLTRRWRYKKLFKLFNRFQYEKFHRSMRKSRALPQNWQRAAFLVGKLLRTYRVSAVVGSVTSSP